MIVLVKYYEKNFGSQTSVRAGNIDDLKYQIFFRDNLKALIDRGIASESEKVKKQFVFAENVYQAQCNGTLSEETLASFHFDTEMGGFQCIAAARTAGEIDELIAIILELTASRRNANSFIAKRIDKLVSLLTQAKSGETREIVDAINAIHHIL